LRRFGRRLYTAAVPPASDPVIVVSDAHLGHAPPTVAAAFHRFLARVPDLGGHLVVNGDLFDFWFEYRTVIPRSAFPILADLHQLRRSGVRLTLTGGNHDRWGRDFWRRELDAEFHAEGVELELAGWRALVTHGDGLAERKLAARVLHAVTRWPVTIAAFRWVHPDVGIWLADRMSGTLAEHTRDPAALQLVAAAQAEYAATLLSRRPELDLLVLGHTHRPALRPAGERRWYLNPGAWIDGQCFAIVSASGPELKRFV